MTIQSHVLALPIALPVALSWLSPSRTSERTTKPNLALKNWPTQGVTS